LKPIHEAYKKLSQQTSFWSLARWRVCVNYLYKPVHVNEPSKLVSVNELSKLVQLLSSPSSFNRRVVCIQRQLAVCCWTIGSSFGLVFFIVHSKIRHARTIPGWASLRRFLGAPPRGLAPTKMLLTLWWWWWWQDGTVVGTSSS